MNKFGFDLQYKQYNDKKDKRQNDNENEFENHIIKSGEEIKLNVLKGNKGMKNMIRIKMGEYSVDYSSPVDLDEIGDVDVKIPINNDMKQKLIKKNLEIEKKINKLKKKERLRKKLQIIDEKNNEEETKINGDDNNMIKDLINNYNNNIISNNDDIDNNIISTSNENNINNIISTNSKNAEKLLNSNININNLINNNEKNSSHVQSRHRSTVLTDFSESEKSSVIGDEDEISTDSFSFTKKTEKFISKKEGKKELTPLQEKLKKIEERNKKLEKFKMKPRKYLVYSQNNESYLLIRITKAIYNGLIYIVIFPPENPQYIIRNRTDLPISLKQKKDSYNQEIIILQRDEFIPYAWSDTLKDEKLLYVTIDNNDVEVNLNEIKVIRKRLKINENLLLQNNDNPGRNQRIRIAFFFQTIIENNKTRTLIVKGNQQNEINQISFLQRIKQQKKNKNTFNIKIKLYTKGFGISIINSEPRELFYISFYGFLMESQIFSFNKEECFHIIANMNLSLKNFQVDYCLDDLFKSMVIPKNQITAQIEESNQNNIEKLVPLFQGIISYHSVKNNSVTSDEFPQLDFALQPLKVNISNYQIMSLIDFALELKSEFDFYLTEPEKNKKFNNIDDLEKFLFEENSNINEISEYDPEHYDPLLNSKLLILPEEIISNSENHYFFFIKNIAVGSLVIILTTRIDLNSFRVIPTIVSGLSSFIGNIFTHITDYNLYLPSFYYTDVFTDASMLVNQLKNAYISQFKKRIFKIVGSLDILGNPTGYASSIGQGFLEIFEAPRRGLIHGPLGFGGGVAKGFGTFITTIISSSFDIVGKISGTLLASCEELQGLKFTEHLNEREPSNIFSGLFYGVKNGVIFNPELKTERFRYPRTIQKAIRLNSYNEDEATVRAILNYLGGYDEQEIIYFKQFKYIYPGLQGSFSTIILTDKCVMIVYQAKELVFEIELEIIESVEIFKEPNNTNIDLIFNLGNNSKRYIRTSDLSLCIELYLMFENVK